MPFIVILLCCFSFYCPRGSDGL